MYFVVRKRRYGIPVATQKPAKDHLSGLIGLDCFEKEEPDYSKADAILEAMRLTEAETLNCSLNGMTQSEAALYLAISIAGVKYRKMRIRQKYLTYIGSY